MNLRLPLLLSTLCFIPISCQDEKKPVAKKPEPKKEKSEEDQKKSLLKVPAGAVVTDMVYTHRDEDGKKVSLMTIEKLTVSDGATENETILAAQNVKVWLFDDTSAIRSTTTISSADYYPGKEELRAKGEILMIGAEDQFAAKSTGGIFSLGTGQALLLGPATTRIELPKKEPQKNQ